MNRRDFAELVGKGMILSSGIPLFLTHCSSSSSSAKSAGIMASSEDALVLQKGLEYSVLIKEGDPINELMTFGTDNGAITFLPVDDKSGILWVNHEGVNPVFASGYDETKARHRDMITREMYQVGGALVKIEKGDNGWRIVQNDEVNYRLTGVSKIPLEWPELIEDFRSVVGTVANASCTQTPWGSILSGEGHYDFFYGDHDFESGWRTAGDLEWQSFYPKHHPFHFGWIVEVDPDTGSARKHVAMGRMAHSGLEIVPSSNGGAVVYTCDNRADGCVYKFISDSSGSLNSGKLYVANKEAGQWELLDISREELANEFQDQTQLLVRTVFASTLVGGTPLDRPSDLVSDPESGKLFVSLTNDRGANNLHGSIVSLTELEGADGLRFEMKTELEGGSESGFSSPSKLALHPDGDLWFCSSISSNVIGNEDYKDFGNNGLFVLKQSGDDKGEIVQVASAPNESEFGGLHFLPDGETLLLSVQHPGEQTKNLAKLTSNWPGGGTTVPQSAVVAIQGDLIKTKKEIS